MSEQQAAAEAAAAASALRWYVVHAYSGMEKAVERNLQASASSARACRPSSAASWCRPKKWSSSRAARRPSPQRRFFPGYVLVEMLMDDDTWHLVKHTSKVTGFVGGARNRPAPISEAEVMKIVNQMQEGIDKPKPKVEWQVGELVRVKEGPFTDFNGAVEEVNYEKSKVKVSVTIFGRATGVELDFSQVEKV